MNIALILKKKMFWVLTAKSSMVKLTCVVSVAISHLQVMLLG